MKNIFVVGLEPFNLGLLNGLPAARDYRFHELLGYKEAVRPTRETIDLTKLLKTAEQRLRDFSGSIDAIIGYWDFPTSVLVPVLNHRLGLPGPALPAVAACEHKYWSRVAQASVLGRMVPEFRAVDPFASDPLNSLNLQFPFWLKPVKAHSSYLGFKIRDEQEFNSALPIIRAGIRHFGDPFDAFLSMVDIPDFVAGIGGSYCIAEEIISQGEQCTLEGWAFDGTVHVYGVVDSIRSGEHQSCFSRYQYPSKLPGEVQARMVEAAERFIRHIGYTNAPFNAEFYWNADTDEIRILEINSRISKSHCPLFLMVDGVSHQQVLIDLALGVRPSMPHRQGHSRISAKFMERIFSDGLVEEIPSEADLSRLKEAIPDSLMRILAKKGQRLAHLPYQDSYSFEIAEIFLGARDEPELLQKHEKALELLPFKIIETGAETS
jgi:biotin carboxylase